MKKIYEVTRDFWVGECNIQLRKGDEISYDDISSALFVEKGMHEARNLKAAIKAKWLVPVDGKYPELDGPLGETEDQKGDRKRKERFLQQASKKKEVPSLVKDERQVGVIGDESDLFGQMLNAEPVASVRVGKKSFDIVEDDTKEVGAANVDKSETRAIKKALNQDSGDKEKQDPSEFKVFNDHYDAEALHIGKYNDPSNLESLKGWSTLHWSKKAEVIKSSKDKTFLTQLKGVETSKKIKARITEQLESLQ